MRICIVGGGAIGSVAARYLADRGHNVTLVEQDSKLCSRTSGGNASLLCFDDSISIFKKNIDIKSSWTLIRYHPLWLINYFCALPKEKEIIKKQKALLKESQRVFHSMVPIDYKYNKLVKYSDGRIKENTYQVYTPDLVNKLVLHPNIHIKFNNLITDIVIKNNKITSIKTQFGEIITADIFVFCKGTNDGPIIIAPLYGQTLVKSSSQTPYSIINSDTNVVENVICNKKRLSFGAIIRKNKKDAIEDLHFPGQTENWEEILTNPRPVSPDSLPIICKDKKIDNLYYSGGHGFLGWSMSFVSAQILNDIIDGKSNDYIEWVKDRFIM